MKQIPKADSDDLPMIFNINNSSKIKSKSHVAQQYTFFLDEPIGDPSNYREEIFTLIHASEYDTIDIILNTPGGQIHTARAICEAIKNSQAAVTGILIGDCSSAGTIIALSCPSLLIMDSAEFMIHTAQFGSVGKSHNVKDHVDFTTNQINKLIDETYVGFLTKPEIEKVKTGVEFWFDAAEIKVRMASRIKYLQAEDARLKKLEAKKATAEATN